MAILLTARNLSKSFSSRPLFEGLTFGLSERERTGLIGPNGAGKSTLLKILAGREAPDAGEISMRRGLRVGYVPQRDEFASGGDGIVRDELARSLRPLGLEDWEVDIRLEDGLAATGFTPEQKIAGLSGGWRKRLAILAQVLAQPDLLLLDEPTNHLDLEGVLWLETLLRAQTFSFLMVTHDRRFLESVANRVIELDKRYVNGHFSSAGAYSDFIESREKLFSAQAQQESAARNRVRHEIEWLRRGPKARTTKQKARVDRAEEMISDLAELSTRNAQTKSIAINFSSRDRRTKKLIECAALTKSLGGRKLFGPLDFMLGPGDKLGLLGANGSGKSTLLKLLAGSLEPDSGVIKRADGLRVITFDQHREQLNPDWPLRKALCENGEKVEYQGNWIHVAGWAARFLFTADQLDKPLSKLSGGEQARVLIARLMLRPADVLLLDEPTNDLDINSLEVLEASLMDFAGAVVLVTHDRYLLDRVSQQILALDGKGNGRFFADLAQWEDAVAAEPAAAPANVPAPAPPAPPPPAPRKQKPGATAKALKKLEADIALLESQCEQAKAALDDPAIASNAAELVARQGILSALQMDLEGLMGTWEDLSQDAG